MIKKILAIIIFVASTNLISLGQSSTNSPYTRFGIGEIERNGFNNSKAMGGISTGLRMNNQINYMNPAAVSSQDTMSFIFDVGLSGTIKNLESNSASSSFKSGGFNHVAMSFPLKRWWFVALGVTPYSKIGYNVKTTEPHRYDESINLNYYYYGDGGLNQVFFSNSFKFLNNFSVGFNINYLFGSIEEYRQTNVEGDFQSNVVIIEDKIRLNDFTYDIGAQYFNKINDKGFYTIGINYSNQASISGEKENTAISVPYYKTDDTSIKDYVQEIESRNYLSSYEIIDTLSSKLNDNYSIDIPAKYSIGLSAGIKDKLLVGFDYSFQDWSEVKEFDVSDASGSSQSVDFSNEQSFNFGLEYIPNRYSFRSYLAIINYRVGMFYNKSYLKLNGNQINNYGITFGLGIPISNKKTSLNLSCTVGKKGTLDNNLIEENFTSFGVNFTLYDFWFFKRKYQ